MIRHHIGSIIVAGANSGAALFGVVVEHRTHLGHRKHRDGDVVFVHLLQGALRCPAAAECVRAGPTASRSARCTSTAGGCTASAASAESRPGVDARRNMVMVNVDTSCLGG